MHLFACRFLELPESHFYYYPCVITSTIFNENTRVSFYVQEYDPKSIMAEPLCSNPIDTVAEAYFQGIGDQLCRRPEANARSGLEVRDGLPFASPNRRPLEKTPASLLFNSTV